MGLNNSPEARAFVAAYRTWNLAAGHLRWSNIQARDIRYVAQLLAKDEHSGGSLSSAVYDARVAELEQLLAAELHARAGMESALACMFDGTPTGGVELVAEQLQSLGIACVSSCPYCVRK